MNKKRIFFTGGSGKAGRHVIPYLLDQGHRVLNVDLVPLNHPGVDNLIVDITDSGQIFNAMSSYAGLDELELEYGQAFSTFVYSRSDWDSKLRITPLYKNVEREGIRI